jgi:hypothetical protein
MPYIKQQDRNRILATTLDPQSYEQRIGIRADNIENCGELNYAITVLVQSYLKRKGRRYQNINDVVGALEGAKLELYRRTAAPYEDEKIEENGDVNLLG